MPKCIKCHSLIGEDSRYCPYCGTKVIKITEFVCPSCGKKFKDFNVKFCSQCGTKLLPQDSTQCNNQITEHGRIESLEGLVNALNRIIVSIDKKADKVSEEEILKLCDVHTEGRYDIFYKAKKHKGRYRMISVPNPRLRLILCCIKEILQELFVPAKYVTGYVKNTSIIDNGKIHVGQRFVYTIDLCDFFDTIKLDLVERSLTLEPFNFNLDISKTIASLSCVINRRDDTICLSQGSPLSPILSNIAFADLDKKLNGLASFYGAKYSRYADDITFSSSINLFSRQDELAQSVRRVLDKCKFRINNDKVRVYGPQTRHYITGIVANERVNVPRDYIRSIRNLLYIWERYGIRDAYRKFDAIYQKKGKGKTTPFIGDYLRGQIEYVGAVRGRDDDIYLRFKEKLSNLLSVPFVPFCGSYDHSTKRYKNRHGRISFDLSSPFIKHGLKYYRATTDDGVTIMISPKLNEYIESGADSSPKYKLVDSCSFYKVFDKDGVKTLMSKK